MVSVLSSQYVLPTPDYSGRGVLKCLHNMEGEILNFLNSHTNLYTNELILIHVPVQWG